MSLRGLDEYITGNYGEDYWKDEPYKSDGDPWVCGFCRAGGCQYCRGGECDCPGFYGRTAAEHGPYEPRLKLIPDKVLTLNDGQELTLNDGTK